MLSDYLDHLTFPYLLQPYAGLKSRTTCPSCGTPRSFTRYVTTESGELLPEVYGRCDREVKCGFHRSPYHDRERTGQRAQALRLGAATMRQPHRSLIHTIPNEVFTASLAPTYYSDNTLACLLRRHFGTEVADGLLRRFNLGTSTYWPGACVFWLVDEQGRARDGQVVRYDETGHTVKTPFRHTCWAHTALAHKYRQCGQPLPSWLVSYTEHAQKSPGLFGLPQLRTEPMSRPVALGRDDNYL